MSIEVNRDRVKGAPVIPGTRFPIDLLLSLLQHQSLEEVIEDYDLPKAATMKAFLHVCECFGDSIRDGDKIRRIWKTDGSEDGWFLCIPLDNTGKSHA